MRPLPIVVLMASLSLLLGAGADKAAPPAAAVLAVSSDGDAAAAKAIDAYAAWGFGQIAKGSPEEVKEARKAMASVLRKQECTPVFYGMFLKGSRSVLEPILASSDGFRATNALMVLRQVKSLDAVLEMAKQCNAGTQKQVSVRIAAGSMLTAMITSNIVRPIETDKLTRPIRECVEAETSPLAAARCVEALAALGANAEAAKLGPQARGALTELIASATVVANRTAQPGGEDFAGALFRALIGIRDQCVKMPQAEQVAMGSNTALKDLLGKVSTLQIAASGKTADAARELTAARSVADALSGMTGLSKPQPAKK